MPRGTRKADEAAATSKTSAVDKQRAVVKKAEEARDRADEAVLKIQDKLSAAQMKARLAEREYQYQASHPVLEERVFEDYPQNPAYVEQQLDFGDGKPPDPLA